MPLQEKQRFGAIGGLGLGLLAGVQPFYEISHLTHDVNDQDSLDNNQTKKTNKSKKQQKPRFHLMALQDHSEPSLRGTFNRLFH